MILIVYSPTKEIQNATSLWPNNSTNDGTIKTVQEAVRLVLLHLPGDWVATQEVVWGKVRNRGKSSWAVLKRTCYSNMLQTHRAKGTDTTSISNIILTYNNLVREDISYSAPWAKSEHAILETEYVVNPLSTTVCDPRVVPSYICVCVCC